MTDDTTDQINTALEGHQHDLLDAVIAALWHYDTHEWVETSEDGTEIQREAPRPGAFSEALVAAIAKADPTNRDKLALGFPSHVAAVRIATEYPEGTAELRKTRDKLIT